MRACLAFSRILPLVQLLNLTTPAFSMSTNEFSSDARQIFALRAVTAIPPTAVGGSFRPAYNQSRLSIRKYHARKWVDRSSVAYNRHGPSSSRFCGRRRLDLNSSPTAVGGIPNPP